MTPAYWRWRLGEFDGGQDPVDTAIRAAATKANAANPSKVTYKLTKFVPFDPATKISEATAVDTDGGTLRVVKGAFAAVIKLTEPTPTAAATEHELEVKGFRFCRCRRNTDDNAAGRNHCAERPTAHDAAELIKELHTLGVRMVMVTGDAPATAAIIAQEVGLEARSARRGQSRRVFAQKSSRCLPEFCPRKVSPRAGVQKSGHTVGMCGDGANDAPALRQAQMELQFPVRPTLQNRRPELC